MSDRLSYEVVVVGGGPAGMTTALYTTRLGHRTAVIEKKGGRHAAVSNVHNLYGVSEDVSGEELRKHAVAQLGEYGGDYYLDSVDDVRRIDDAGERGDGADADDAAERFVVSGEHTSVEAERVVFATGFKDLEPDVPDLRQFVGRGLHYCIHCDAYVLGDERVFVLGHGEHAAEVAMLMLNFTADVELLLDGRDAEWSDETDRQLRAHPIEIVREEVVGAFARNGGDETWLGGLTFADGTDRQYLGGFAMYGKDYNAALAESLGCDLADDGAVAVDERYETSVEGAYAVGDVTHGQNQTVIAMGDGAKAGIAIHKELREFPRPADETGDVDESDVPGAADDLRARMRLDRERRTHWGLREPKPDR